MHRHAKPKRKRIAIWLVFALVVTVTFSVIMVNVETTKARNDQRLANESGTLWVEIMEGD